MALDDQKRISEIQTFLREEKLDGWLLYDFGGANKPANRILKAPGLLTRRWFILIPAKGDVRVLHHRIESGQFEHLSCEKRTFVGWKNLEQELRALLKGYKKIAMEYSPNCAIPTISRVDAGMLEWIRSFGLEIVSSANLIQVFEARWSARSLELHAQATEHVMNIIRSAADLVKQSLAEGTQLTEYDVQQRMWHEITTHNLVTNDMPMVGFEKNSGDVHYQPNKDNCAQIKKDGLLLLDCWLKASNDPDAVYSDITWMYYTGSTVPAHYADDFAVIRDARDQTSAFIQQRVKAGQPIYGYEADDVCRNVLRAKKLDQFFIHRTGHNIDAEDHGSGVNLDNLETRDDRKLIAGVGFSVEPGIYRDTHGVRTEINMHISEKEATVLTPEQTEIERLF